MTDTRNEKRLQVSDGGDGWLYIRVAADQLGEVRKLLDREGIRYWADTFAVSLNGKPAVTVISLGVNNDANRVQAILDAAG
jgi:hypothetical protein